MPGSMDGPRCCRQEPDDHGPETTPKHDPKQKVGELGIRFTGVPDFHEGGITMCAHGTSLWSAACRFGLLAGMLGQFALAPAVLADSNQDYVQSQWQPAAVAASVPEVNPYGTMAAASISPFVGEPTASEIEPDFPNASASVSGSGSGGIVAATAKTFSGLASGQLGAYAQSHGPATTSAASESGLWDTLTFSGASGSATGTIRFSVSGNFVSTGQGSACLLLGPGLCNPLFLTPLQSWPTLDGANPSEVLTASFSIVNGSPVEFSAGLYAQANNPTAVTVIQPTADLYDPASLSLQLPPNVTYRSASGVFLTSPVPLPPALWLFGSGMIGLLSIARCCRQEVRRGEDVSG